MREYNEFRADIYDFEIDIEIDIPMYLRYAQKQGSPILELGCGTGRVTLPLARAGFEIWGIDCSAPMLDKARRKAAQEPSIQEYLHFIQADMQAFQIDNRFKLVFIPYNTFMHLLTRPHQNACLQCIRKHLCDDGLLIIDIKVPYYANLKQSDGTLICRFQRLNPETGNTLIRMERVARNLVDQLEYIEYIYDEVQPDGNVKRTIQPTIHRYIFQSELELLLEKNGYKIVSMFGGCNEEPYNYYSGQLVCVASKSFTDV